MSYARVSLGDGKFCYSGPNCRKHGGAVTGSGSTGSFVSSVKSRLSDTLVEGERQLNDFICENSLTMKDLHGLGDDALQKGRAARWCDKCKAYHVYEITPVNAFRLKVLDKAGYGFVDTVVENGSVSGAEAGQLRGFWRGEVEKFAGMIQDDKKTLIVWQRSINGTVFGDAAQAKFDDLRAEAKALEVRREVELAEARERRKVPLLLPVDKISKPLLLEYWQCGRKRQFDSLELAGSSIHEKDAADSMGPYACRHCGRFHVGHGDGKDSVENQLGRAEVWWVEYPAKSNAFAEEKGLL